MTNYFTVTRTFAASRELVFKAMTEPEHFAVWFGTANVEAPLETLQMEVRPGGKFKAQMVLPDGMVINWVGEYAKVNPPAEFSLALTDDPASLDPNQPDYGEPIEFLLTEVTGGTLVTVRQDRAGFTEEQVQDTIAGYSGFFDDLAKELVRVQSTN